MSLTQIRPLKGARLRRWSNLEFSRKKFQDAFSFFSELVNNVNFKFLKKIEGSHFSFKCYIQQRKTKHNMTIAFHWKRNENDMFLFNISMSRQK